MLSKRYTTKKQWEGYFFILPAMLFFLLFLIYPILFNIVIGFFKWNGIGANFSYVGLGNYIKLFTDDPIIKTVFKNTGLLILLMVPFNIGYGLIIAYLLNFKIRFTSIYRTLFFTPAIVPGVVVATLFGYILQPSNGLLNTILRRIGLDIFALGWLSDPKVVIFTLIVVVGWLSIGFAMIIYLAGLKSIPIEVCEAAQVDGASEMGIFFKIILPLLRSQHTILIMLGIIGVFRLFDIVWVLTKAGPAHQSEISATYIYHTSIIANNVGYASAIAVIVFIIVLTFTIFQLYIFRKK